MAKDAVAEALDLVLKSDTTETVDKGSEDSPVKQALESALGADKKAAPADAKDKGTDGDKTKTVPYDRFSEVVTQKNEAIERLKTLDAQFKSANERETVLKSRVGQLETSSQIVEAIKELAKDERYRSHVVAIDKALQGVHEEVEQAKDKGDDKALKVAETRLQGKIDELEEMAAEQKADALWTSSNEYARNLLASLPQEYNDEDKALLSQLWSSRVDWDYIEENGREVIPPTLQKSLAELIKSYGTPRGALVSRTKDEITKSIPEAARPKSPEDRVKGILDVNWAETKEGKPVHSDEEWAKAAAEVLRATRGR